MQPATTTAHAPDAIPREIHERLVRDAKAQALRDAAEKIADQVELFEDKTALRIRTMLRALASDHERGGK